MVDEIGGMGRAREQPGNRLALANHDRRGAVAGRHLDRACRLGATLLGRHDQRLAGAGQRCGQRRRRRALRRGDVERRRFVRQVQGRGNDAGVEPVEERERRRG